MARLAVSAEPAAPTLHDAAALLVQLEPDDREGIGRLAELLQAVSGTGDWGPQVAELIGRALWRVMDAADGDADGLADAGAAIEQAMELLEEGDTGESGQSGEQAAAAPAA